MNIKESFISVFTNWKNFHGRACRSEYWYFVLSVALIAFVLGFVEDQWLPAIYANAMAFIYPSLHEGFGLPPLEAMTCGTPVLLSNASSLPEVGGDAALYFDPLSVEAIEEAIEKIIFDVDLQKTMSEKSLIQSKQFSWDKTAQQTEEVYAKVLGL